MCECGHEDDGGMNDEGLENAAVPGGDNAKQKSGEEDVKKSPPS